MLAGLISLQVGAVDASAYMSGLSATAVLAAFGVVRRTFGVPAAGRGGPPCDSWCSPELPVSISARS